MLWCWPISGKVGPGHVVGIALGRQSPTTGPSVAEELGNMAHHKRRKRKNARAGCGLCKPHKRNGQKGRPESQTMQARRNGDAEREARDEIVPMMQADEIDISDATAVPWPTYDPADLFMG